MLKRLSAEDIPISRLATALIAFIMVSSIGMRQVMLAIRGVIGDYVFGAFVLAAIVILTGVFVLAMVRACPSLGTRLALATLILLGVALTIMIKLPEEKIHIIEFGLLGWLLTRDIHMHARRYSISKTISACFFFSVIDETLQGILPYRVYDIRDIVFNLAGAIWGIGLYLIYYARKVSA